MTLLARVPMRTTSTATLSSYLGKNILQICYNKYNPRNNCAHFVGHALGIHVGMGCYDIVGGALPGASIRVNEIFNDWCPTKGKWSKKPTALYRCLLFISIPINVILTPLSMKDHETKHIGIYVGGTVWHYSNTMKKVVAVPESQMHRHYPGQTMDWMFYGTFGPSREP